MMRRFKSAVRLFCAMIAFCAFASSSSGQQTPPQIDWNKIDSEALGYFRTYLRFDTTNPPSNTKAAIAYLKSILDKEGIATETFESKPGMVSLVARIPGPAGVKPLLLLSHAEQLACDTARELLFPLLETGDGAWAEYWRSAWYFSRAASILGGTAEVQRGLVAQRVLGLPREIPHGS